ncbi:MAG: hypothetical protein R3F59_12160 [Myxococcota bacterium]
MGALQVLKELRGGADAVIAAFLEVPAGELLIAAADALPPLLTADNCEPLFRTDLPPERQDEATAALVVGGVHDPRLVERLRDLLVRDPSLTADLCAIYGDPALVPDVAAAFDRCLKHLDELQQYGIAAELVVTLAALGARDEGRERRLTAAMAAVDAQLREPGVPELAGVREVLGDLTTYVHEAVAAYGRR